MITYVFAEIQILGTMSFERLELAENLRGMRETEDSNKDMLLNSIWWMKKRATVSHNTQIMIDSYGTAIIATEIMSKVTTSSV